MTTLRNNAKEWLDKYKAGEPCSGLLDTEDVAAIVAEYLHETPSGTEGEDTSERIKALQTKAELLHEDLVAEQGKTAELEKRNKELEFQLAGAENRVLRLEGENSAYRFAIRCNGMSGAEVRS